MAHGEAEVQAMRVAMVVAAVVCVVCGYSPTTVVRSGSSRTYSVAESDCTGRRGGVAVTTSPGELSVVEMTSSGVVWLGGQELRGGEWAWVGGVAYSPSRPKVFYRGGGCVFGLCKWASGEPQGGRGRMLLVAQRHQTSTGAASNYYECEVPYAVRFQCFRQSSGTGYDEVYEDCKDRGGYLGTVPRVSAWTAIKGSSGCSSLPDTRIGADDYDANAFDTQNFNPTYPGYFHWRSGPLAAERGGQGRLLSSGASPNTVLYGLVTQLYADGQPTLGPSQHTIEVLGGSERLNDYTWRPSSSGGAPAYVCEFPAALPPPPPPPPPPPTTTPPTPTPSPTTGLPADSCFRTVDVAVTGEATVSGCAVRGGRIVVTGLLTMDDVRVENAVIEVAGGGRRKLDVRGSTLTNVGILVKGVFADGSAVRVWDSTVSMTMPVDLEQPTTMAAWVHLLGVEFQASGLVELVRNTVTMPMGVPTVSVAVLYSSTGVTMDSTPLRVVWNTVQASAAGPMSALVLSEGDVRLRGTARLEVVANTVSLSAASRAVLVVVPALSVDTNGVGNVTDNVVALRAAKGELYSGRVTTQGLVEWRHNDVRYGPSTPVVVDSAVEVVTAGSRAVLTENILEADRTVAVPELELTGPVSGAGTLAVGCTMFFGRFLLTLAELRPMVPAFAKTVLEPCTSGFVATPGGGGGSSVGSSTAGGGVSTQLLLPIVIGSVLGFLALLLLAIIVVALWRRQRRVSHRSRYAKSTSVTAASSSRGSASRSTRRSSRTSLRSSRGSGSLATSTSAQ